MCPARRLGDDGRRGRREPNDHGSARVINSAPREAGPLVALLLIGGLCLVALGLAEAVRHGATATVDQRVFLLFRRPGDPGQTIGPMWLKEAALDQLGSTVVLGLALGATLGYLLMARKRAAAVLVLAAVAGGQALSALLRPCSCAPGRSRPGCAGGVHEELPERARHGVGRDLPDARDAHRAGPAGPAPADRPLGLAVGFTMGSASAASTSGSTGRRRARRLVRGRGLGAALRRGRRALQRRGRIEAPGPVPPAES